MAQQWDSPPLVVGVGELLWDLLPAGKKAGGAPFNFAFHATQAGARGIPLSRVGHDDLGAELLEQVRDRGLPVTHIQVDEGFPTGTVTVELQGGSPRYIIHGPTAWDQLSWTADWETVAKNAAAICFGTLAQRNDHARATIHKLVQTGAQAGALIVADLNLRQHFYSQQILQDSIRLARWLKMSAEDWVGVARCLHLDEARPWEELKTLREKHNLELVAYTDGEKGAWLCSAEGTRTIDPVPVQVADTVGAGDAFTAALLAARNAGADWLAAGRYAAAFAAEVVARPGGTPIIEANRLVDLKKRYLPG